jgi:hypothetical protein
MLCLCATILTLASLPPFIDDCSECKEDQGEDCPLTPMKHLDGRISEVLALQGKQCWRQEPAAYVYTDHHMHYTITFRITGGEV